MKVTPQALLEELYTAIRHVRDQQGDDKCFRDWHAVYELLPEGYDPPLVDTEITPENCAAYARSIKDPSVKYVSPQRRIEKLEEALQRIMRITNCLDSYDVAKEALENV